VQRSGINNLLLIKSECSLLDFWVAFAWEVHYLLNLLVEKNVETMWAALKNSCLKEVDSCLISKPLLAVPLTPRLREVQKQDTPQICWSSLSSLFLEISLGSYDQNSRCGRVQGWGQSRNTNLAQISQLFLLPPLFFILERSRRAQGGSLCCEWSPPHGCQLLKGAQVVRPG